MARSTQYIGHTKKVLDFLAECKKLSTIGVVTGMFGEEVCELYEFQDNNGDVWEEFEQYSPWSSGPVIFLGIRRKKDGKVMGWTPIEKYEVELIDYEKGVFYV